MGDLTSVLRRAAIRINVGRFLTALVTCIAVAIGLLTLTLIVQRLVAFPVPWMDAWLIAMGAAVIAALVWTLATMPSRLAVARRVDEQAGLRESLSTALCVAGQPDSWSQATVRFASEQAKSVRIGKAFPAKAPRLWPAPLIGAATFALLTFLLPQGDLLGMLARAEEQRAAEDELQQAVAIAQASEEEVRSQLAALGEHDLDDQFDGADLEKPKTPEQALQRAVRRVTSAHDRVQELRQSEQGQRLDAMREMMRQIRQPGPGPLGDMVRAMQDGDFKSANEELARLADKLAAGEMSDVDRQRLQEQLENLAEQLNKLAQQRNELAEQLERLGLDPDLARNPEALQQALDQLDGLNEQQRQELMDKAKAMQQAAGLCEQMGMCLGGAAQALADGAGAEGMDGIGEMLDQLEMLAQEMAGADAALESLGNQLRALGQCFGDGPAEFNMWSIWSGAGNGPPEKRGIAEADFDLEKKRSPSPTQEGPIIGRRMVEGEQIRGESRAEFIEVVRTAGNTASEAIEDNLIPREHQAAVKRYFGRLERRAAEAAEQAEQSPQD